MKAFLLVVGLALTSEVEAETLGFGSDTAGAAPAGWTCGVTGSGSQRWVVERDNTAPSPPNVLRHVDPATFAWCVRAGASMADGMVQVAFKPVDGTDDQAGGVVWRWKNGNSYYVARANALEGNVSLYYVLNGKRTTIQYVPAPVPADTWNTLRVTFQGSSIRVSLNGKTFIDTDDRHISGSGRIGVWTKADSVTLFDDFTYSLAPAK